VVALAATSVGPARGATAAPVLASVQRGTVSTTVSATGNVQPALTEPVNFPTSGTLTEIDAKVGDQVQAGQVLARIDPTAAQAAVSAAQLNMNAAQDNLALAQGGGETPPQKAQDANTLAQAQNQVTTANNNLATAQGNLAADQQACQAGRASACNAVNADNTAVTNAQNSVNQANTNLTSTQLSVAAKQYVNPATVAQAQATVIQDQSNLTQAQKTLNETSLTAPVDGTITAANGVVGQTVSGAGASAASSSGSASSGSSGSAANGAGGAGAAGASGSAASGSSSAGSGGSSSSALFTVTDVTHLQEVAGFAEVDAAKLQIGQPATITVSALPGQQLAAHLVSLDVLQTVVSNVVTYNATFALDNTVSGLKPGMTANVSVIVAEADNVLHVPSSAVTTRGGGSTVTVVNGKSQQVVSVVTGMRGDNGTVIQSGLTQGQQVLVPSARVSSSAGTATGTVRGLGGGGLGGGGVVGGFGGGGGGGGGAGGRGGG
jgi:multidrug efflux pump subunit AcrA (membrane-fusion protein)